MGDDVGHFVQKHKTGLEHAAEIAGGIALLATGPESWGVSGALFGEAAAEGAVDVGVGAAEDGVADAATDGVVDDATVAPKPGVRGMVGRMGRNAYGNLKPVVIGSVAGPTVTKDLGMGGKPPPQPAPTQKPAGDGGAAAYANAQAQQQRGMAYVNNLNSLSQNDSRGFSSGGINPWA
jgi:hypothetical protein